MGRRFGFLVAFLSVSVPQRDCFANGFLLPRGVPRSKTASLSSSILQSKTMRTKRRFRRETLECDSSFPIIRIRRTKSTHLFSQTTRPEQQDSPTPQTKAKTTKPSTPKKVNAAKFAVTEGPDLDTKPDYEKIHGPLGKTLDNIFMSVFRTKLAEHVGVDSKLPKTDFSGLMELTVAMNARYSDRREIQKIAQQTLRSLFPSWLPGQFAILFSKPFPEFSSRMNAWATWVAGQWLMGECEINDIEIDGRTYKGQGVLVKRCRFLEESGCASVCVNSCKIPTQKFFIEDMGLPLTMTPDYETYECQFSFGRTPTDRDDFDAMSTPCLSRCPMAGSMREWHNARSETAKREETLPPPSSSALLESGKPPENGGQCAFMENQPGDENPEFKP